jgi:hypothetical protein
MDLHQRKRHSQIENEIVSDDIMKEEKFKVSSEILKEFRYNVSFYICTFSALFVRIWMIHNPSEVA